VAGCSLSQHVGQHPRNDARIESAAAEESGQSPILNLARKCTHGCSSALDQIPSSGELGVEPHIVEGSIDIAAIDSLSLKLTAEYPTGQVAALLT
jgi:hypothetical protein